MTPSQRRASVLAKASLDCRGSSCPSRGRDVDLTAPVRYVDPAELARLSADVAGQIIVTEAGAEDAGPDVRAWLAISRNRARQLDSLGAAALVEVYRSGVTPFRQLAGGVNRDGMTLDDPASSTALPVVYVKAETHWDGLRLGKSTARHATLRIVAPRSRRLTSDNIVAVLPGTDPTLANEYIAVTAHFDHIGVTPRPGLADSINNGARDNGMGTVALLEVARRWSDDPGERPLLLMAWTAEEKGLLGSRYWAAHPTVPLDQVLFNFNMDGAGYDDTTGVVFNGYGFTAAQPLIDRAVSAESGLEPRPDPMPQYGLYRQSDNYSLAGVGLPAINMAPGFTGFSAELMRYYHQPLDEASAVSPTYLQAYAEAAVAAVRALADAPREALTWDRKNDTVREYVDLGD